MRRAILALGLLLAACGSDREGTTVTDNADAQTHAASDAASDAVPDDAVDLPCPTGHVLGPDGECMAVGIEGCDDMFINPETGLCEPSPDHCPPGQIPIFSGDDQGCRVVGIPGCDDMFINPETGLCDPTPDHCPPGSIPIFSGDDQGCRKVGILDCAPEFIDAETGLCDPDPDFCDEGFIPVPTQGCVSLDPPEGCGEGTWGGVEELPGDVHVDVGYAGGDSDGSREKPWTLIAYAIGNTQPGGRMVLAAGVYDEGVLLAKSISLVGRCSSMVTISGTRMGVQGPTVVEAKGSVDAGISDVKISGAGVGITAHTGALLTLDRVRIEDNQGRGIDAGLANTTIYGTDVLVARTQPYATAPGARGVSAELGASITLHRAHLVDNSEVAVYLAQSGSSVALNDVLVARTQPVLGTGDAGLGFYAGEAATLSVERSVVSENAMVGVWISDPGTHAHLSQVVIARTLPTGSGEIGMGIRLVAGATLTLEDASLVGNHSFGMYIGGYGTTASTTNLLVTRTRSDDLGSYGWGTVVEGGGALTMSRAVLTGSQRVGLGLLGATTSVTASEIVIHGTTDELYSTVGKGIQVDQGATLSLERALLSDNLGLSFDLRQDTTAEVLDVTIARTKPDAQGAFGRGGQVALGAALSMERAAIVDNHEVGLGVSGSTTQAELHEVLIARTQPTGQGLGGRGLVIQGNTSVTASRLNLLHNHGSGAGIYDLETDVIITEALIAQTQPLPDGSFGRGITVLDGAHLALERTALTDNHDAGLILDQDGTSVQATELLVARTRPGPDGKGGRGIHVQTGGLLTLDRVSAMDNHEMGVTFLASGGSVTNSLIQGTRPSPANTGGVADGILVMGSVVTITGVVARGNIRAGILYYKSQGDISSCLITGNAIGLANQGLPGATIADDNVVTDNEQNFLEDGNLSVPDEAMEIPDVPKLD